MSYLVVCVCGGGSRIPCRRGRRPSGGAPIHDFVKISEKLHEIEKILGHGGAREGAPPLNPPLVWTTI